MSRLVVLLLATALGAAALKGQAGEPAVCDQQPCIQVGSYNIELLGQQRRAYGGQERPLRSPDQLASLARRVADTLDLEVVVFQEIDTESDQWSRLKKDLAGRGYRFFEGTTSGRDQFVVLAWDADEVQLIGSARELDLPEGFKNDGNPKCRYQGLRKPVAGQFRAGEFDFWVVGVHLKSRSHRNIPDWCPAWIRRQQTTLLADEIRTLIADSGEKDVLVIGDFNERYGHESLEPLRDLDLTSQMLYRMNGSASVSYVKGSPDLIDHVMLDYDETQELVPRSGFVMPVKEEERDTYIREASDHVPVWASFRTDQDRD